MLPETYHFGLYVMSNDVSCIKHIGVSNDVTYQFGLYAVSNDVTCQFALCLVLNDVTSLFVLYVALNDAIDQVTILFWPVCCVK